MRRSIHFAVIVLALISAVGPPGIAAGDVAGQLAEAQQLVSSENYEQAEQIYKQILAGAVAADSRLEAQKQLAVLYAAWGKPADGQAAYEALPASERESAAEGASLIAYKHLKGGRREEALGIYQYIVDSWSQGEYAIWLGAIEAISAVRGPDDAAAEASVNKLLTDFSEHKDIAKAANKVGDNYYGPRDLPTSCGYLAEDRIRKMVAEEPGSVEYSMRRRCRRRSRL